MSHFQLCLSFSDLALGNEMHHECISLEMMNTSGAINCNKSNSLMKHSGREGGVGGVGGVAKSAALPPIN